jgi:hypothetical protein
VSMRENISERQMSEKRSRGPSLKEIKCTLCMTQILKLQI